MRGVFICNNCPQLITLLSNSTLMQNVSTFLMFTGQAEDAMNLYSSVIPGCKILDVKKYEANQPPGPEGKVYQGKFSIGDQLFTCFDSPPVHQFGFTPSISIFLTCSSEAEVDEIYTKLSEGGGVMMPLGPYPFSKKYAWFADKFGVSWQVSFNG
jgi:predicted 3-demethylubiquinone-9 3-methyltransferase (glyoxalase superfamily)